jgi:chromosome segregation ATPase
MPPSEQPTKSGPSPELSAAQRRVSNLELDIANLRRGMVQQLTASGKLLKAIFSLDQDYFGGRFQAQDKNLEKGQDKSPTGDLLVATQVVEAVAEQLAGESAFADSPMLRDCVGTLVAAVESLRNAAIEVERGGAASVGLPSTADHFPARTFPDNNPLACLNQAAAFCRDVQGVCSRTRDRLTALKMMLHEAERSRAEAESAVSPVNVEDVSKRMSDEISARDSELSSLRQQTLDAQEQNTTELRRIRAEMLDVREALARESDLHRADHAEARSLAAEIERLAAGDPEVAASDDLEITLAVLHEQLEHGVELGSIAGAAEAVMVGWAKLVTERMESLRRELSQLAAAHAAAKPDPAEGLKASRDLDEAKARLLDANTRLNEAHQRLQAREQEIKRLVDERTAEKAVQAREREELARQASNDTELTVLRKQLAEVTRSLQTSELAVRTREEALRGRDADFHRLESEVVRLRETSASQLSEAKTKNEGAQAELTRIRAENEKLTPALTNAIELQRLLAIDKDALAKARDQLTKARDEAISGRDGLARERDALNKRIEELRRVQETAAAAARTELDTLKQSLESKTASERQLREELAKSAQAMAAALARAQGLESQVASVVAEKTSVASVLEKTRLDHEAGRRRSTDLETDKSRMASAIRDTESKLRETREDLEKARAASNEALRRAETTAVEVATLKEKLAATVAARDKALAETVALRSSEAQSTGQRDAARSAVATLSAERERLKSDAERISAEREALGTRLSAREKEFEFKSAETSRILTELKTSVSTLQTENQRLQLEVTKLQNDRAAEPRAESTATWSRRLSDSARDLEESRRKATEHTRSLDEQKRQLASLEEQVARSKQTEVALTARIAELDAAHARARTESASFANAFNRAKALENDLANERRRTKEMASLLVASREAVTRARQSLLDAGMR